MVEKEIKAIVCDFKHFIFFAEKLLLKYKNFLMEKINSELVDYLFKQYHHHKENLEHDASDTQKGFRDGLLSAYNEVYAKINEIEHRENPLTDTDWEFDELKQYLEPN